jgi:predicted naringenin-chalcone synthase
VNSRMSFTILGLGTALPARSLEQDVAAELTSRVAGHDADQTRRVATLYRRTGISRRHVVLDQNELPAVEDRARGPTTAWRLQRYDEQIRPLARQAGGRALSSAGIDPRAITHLVTVSCTGFSAPGFDIALIKDLELNMSVERTHVGFMGCHGALNGLRVSRAIAESQSSAFVLLCAAELCSLHFQYGFGSDLAVSNALFADGAAATVGASSGGNRPGAWHLESCGSSLIPDTEDAMAWKIGDHGFEMTLSPRVAQILRGHLRPWLAGWLSQHGLRIHDVASWAIHPGGPRILDAVEEALGIDGAAVADSRDVFSNHGNMSSPTVLFIMDRLRRRRAAPPCVALAFGPGLTIEAALFR